MNKYITIKFTRKEAKSLGLLTCGECGHPENNHFDFDEKECAHCDCVGYTEEVRYGELVKGKK